MSHARGGTLWPLVLAAAAGALGFWIAFRIMGRHVEALAVMRAAPRATLAQPREGAAVYAGRVIGPAGRVDSDGEKAAAHWWWATYRVSKNKTKTVCFEREIDGMRLRDGSHEAALSMFDKNAELGLLGRDRDLEWNDRLLIDLAGAPRSLTRVFPPHARRCEGRDRSFISRSIPAGEEAEVFACHHDGALVACPGPLGAVLALDNLGKHRARRSFAAGLPFMVVSLLACGVLLTLTIRAHRFRARTFGPLVPGGRT